MRVDFSQQAGHRTAITPQLAQQIRLLGLSAQELESEVAHWLDSNVMLEMDEATLPDVDAAADDDDVQAADHELDLDSNWDEGYSPMAGCGGIFDEDAPIAATEARSPVELLLRDLPLECPNAYTLQAACTVLAAIDERGWLERSLHDIACSTGFRTGELVSALALIQRLAPPGFGATDLADCFRLQLRAMPTTPTVSAALTLVNCGLQRLAGREIVCVQRQARLDDATFAEALALLKRLDPHPGRDTREAAPVFPDVVVARLDGRWTVTLSEFATPRIRINAVYAEAIKDSGSAGASLRGQLNEARWLLRGLEQRADTLLKVAHAIFTRQFAFLAGGDEALAPMTLREIAGSVGVHESTVSRVTTAKYVATPRGVFELKHFFGGGLGHGCGASNTAARALVRRFIAGEQPQCPLDDAAIATCLAERGIQVARRTVAKYREAMGIPPARLRAVQSLPISA